MHMSIRTSALFALSIIFASCSDNDDANFRGPDFPTGPGRVFSVQTVTFTTSDDVLVNARFGQNASSGARPVVILLHDIFINGGIEWELPGLGLEMMESLLEEGYQVLLIDFRGFGLTPLPDDGRPTQALSADDIDSLHLEVRAALNWLALQPSADRSRIGIMGVGMGGNAAYVSMGAFPDELQAGIALSPGIYNLNTGESLGVGTDMTPFEPHSMLFIASQSDLIAVSQTQTEPASAIAEELHEITGEPKQLDTRPNDLHGSFLLQDPVVSDSVLRWLRDHL
jgi:dienelactone hydrolase